MLKHSIFLRIYAGLVILVAVVAILAYLLVQIINYQRAQEYRESLTDGMAYIISEGIARQQNEQQKKDWISDASDLLELPIYYVQADKVDLSRTELRRIKERKAAVRYDAENMIAYIILGMKDDPTHYLYIKADKITERQNESIADFCFRLFGVLPGSGKRISGQNSAALFLSSQY